MQQTFPISDPELEALAVNAVSSVFNTMLNTSTSLVSAMKLDEDSSEYGTKLPIDTDQTLITGTVGFIGKMTGIIYIFMDLPLAMNSTCRMLDLEPDDIECEGHETVNDAVGEMTNMIVGTFKNDLSNKGYECRMTIPSILRGSNYTIEPAEAALRRIYKFDCEGRSFVIDILMREEDEQI